MLSALCSLLSLGPAGLDPGRPFPRSRRLLPQDCDWLFAQASGRPAESPIDARIEALLHPCWDARVISAAMPFRAEGGPSDQRLAAHDSYSCSASLPSTKYLALQPML